MGSKKGEKRGPYVKTRAQLAIQKMQENGGVVGQAMREAGYSDEYARQPQKFVATKAFQELANIMLPDIKLLEKHTEMLSSSMLQLMEFPDNVTETEIIGMLMSTGCYVQKIFKLYDEASSLQVYYVAPNIKARMDAIDLGYKIKGHIKPGGASPVMPVQINFNELREKYR